MKAYAIVIKDHETSEIGYNNLCQSSEIVKNNFKITKKQVQEIIRLYSN